MNMLDRAKADHELRNTIPIEEFTKKFGDELGTEDEFMDACSRQG